MPQQLPPPLTWYMVTAWSARPCDSSSDSAAGHCPCRAASLARVTAEGAAGPPADAPPAAACFMTCIDQQEGRGERCSRCPEQTPSILQSPSSACAAALRGAVHSVATTQLLAALSAGIAVLPPCNSAATAVAHLQQVLGACQVPGCGVAPHGQRQLLMGERSIRQRLPVAACGGRQWQPLQRCQCRIKRLQQHQELGFRLTLCSEAHADAVTLKGPGDEIKRLGRR